MDDADAVNEDVDDGGMEDNLVKEKDGEGGVDPEEGGGVGRGRLLSHLVWTLTVEDIEIIQLLRLGIKKYFRLKVVYNTEGSHLRLLIVVIFQDDNRWSP